MADSADRLSSEAADHPRRQAPSEVVFDVDDLSVLLRRLPRRARRHDRRPPARDHGVHRTVGLRQDDGAALLQPDERLHRDGAGSRARCTYHGVNLYDPDVNATEVRRRIGMVFQKPNPFPKSIYDNVAYGPRLAGREEAGRARRHRRALAARRGAVGRGQGPAEELRASACRAVSSSGCASPGRSPSSPR